MIWNLTSIACPFEKKGIRKRHVVLWRWCVLWTKVCVIVRFKSKIVINYNYIKTCTLKWTRFHFQQWLWNNLNIFISLNTTWISMDITLACIWSSHGAILLPVTLSKYPWNWLTFFFYLFFRKLICHQFFFGEIKEKFDSSCFWRTSEFRRNKQCLQARNTYIQSHIHVHC